MHNYQYKLLIIIYLLLLGYTLERSIFAFKVPCKTKPNQKRWLTAIPFTTYIFFFIISVIEFSNKNAPFLNPLITSIGCFTVMLGITLRYQAIITFKKNNQDWFAHIEAKKINSIIIDGPYKYIRHPYYISVIAELSGIALSLNSFMSLFLILTIQGSLLRMRILEEEKKLLNHFGDEYVTYISKVGSFFPKRRLK